MDKSPMIFKNRQWMAAVLMTSIGGCLFFGSASYTPKNIVGIRLIEQTEQDPENKILPASAALPGDFSKETEEEDAYIPGPEELNLAYSYPEGVDPMREDGTADMTKSYAGQIFAALTEMDENWMGRIYNLADQKPEQVAAQLGMGRDAVMGRYDLRDRKHDPKDPSTWTINSFRSIRMNAVNGDGDPISIYSNVIEIMSMANVYTYYKNREDPELFLSYAKMLWEKSHSYSVGLSDIYYCDGCIDEEDERLRLEEDMAAEEAAVAAMAAAVGTQPSEKASGTEDIFHEPGRIRIGPGFVVPETEEAGDSGESTENGSETGVGSAGIGTDNSAQNIDVPQTKPYIIMPPAGSQGEKQTEGTSSIEGRTAGQDAGSAEAARLAGQEAGSAETPPTVTAPAAADGTVSAEITGSISTPMSTSAPDGQETIGRTADTQSLDSTQGSGSTQDSSGNTQGSGSTQGSDNAQGSYAPQDTQSSASPQEGLGDTYGFDASQGNSGNTQGSDALQWNLGDTQELDSAQQGPAGIQSTDTAQVQGSQSAEDGQDPFSGGMMGDSSFKESHGSKILIMPSGMGQVQADESNASTGSDNGSTVSAPPQEPGYGPGYAASPSDLEETVISETAETVEGIETTEDYKCPGHVDLIVNLRIRGIEDSRNGLFHIDPVGNAKENTEEGGWSGWTTDNIVSAIRMSRQDWYDRYGLSLSVISMCNPLSAAEIDSYMNRLPKGLSAERRAVVRFALSSVGRVPYYWGGKPSAPDYGVNGFGSLITPDEKGRILKGLDCSGWINWVYWSATGSRLPYESTSGLALCGTRVYPDDLQPGDILVRTGENAHVIMFLEWTDDGQIRCIHESSAGVNNVTVAVREANWPYYRKLID